MNLFWTLTARNDLKAIRRYIAVDNPSAAKRWVDRLRSRAKKALQAPLAGRKVPEFSREDIRELIAGNYSIVYQVFEDRLVVLTVFEGHRLFPGDEAGASDPS
ncbi:MAG: type II toxin-antitoxin system RelE/ParE family toxin [Desulfobacterales bacterium]|nr:type II toxin-antitoxin system RelE/ParE family toxin [Desulfobacterales bacterium]